MLADCLHHARSWAPTHLVDLATLTGGVVVALGDYHARPVRPDQEWLERVAAAGERGGRARLAAAAARDLQAMHALATSPTWQQLGRVGSPCYAARS